LDPVDAKTTPDIWLRMGLDQRGEFFLNPLTKISDLHLETFEVNPQARSLGEMTGVHKPRSTYLEDSAYLLIRPEAQRSQNFLSIFAHRNYLGH